MVLIVVTLIATQAAINLVSDWNLEPTAHSSIDDMDDDDLQAIKRGVGES